MQPGILRDIIILTVGAAEVAANRGNGIGKGPRQHMEEWFLFDGIDILADQSAIHEAVKNPVPIFPYLAYAPLPFINMTIVRTEKAFDFFFLLISDPLKISSLHNTTSSLMI